jgi:hypothetical protein
MRGRKHCAIQAPRPERGKAQQSDVPQKISHPAFERLGYLRKRFQCDLFFGTLDIANVIPGQIRLLRQFFLTQPGFLSLVANRFSQNAINFTQGRMHSFLSKQSNGVELPTISWYLFRVWACFPLPNRPRKTHAASGNRCVGHPKMGGQANSRELHSVKPLPSLSVFVGISISPCGELSKLVSAFTAWCGQR